MTKRFIVLAEDKELYPMAFITPEDEAGKIRASVYADKLKKGQQLVVVEMTYCQNYNA